MELFVTIFLTAILTWAVERTGDAVLKVIMEKGKSDLPKSDRTSTHPEQNEDKDN